MTQEIMRTGPVPAELELSARELSRPDIPPDILVKTTIYLQTLAEAVEATQGIAKRRTLEYLRQSGVVTETGTMHARVEVGDRDVHIEARIHRHGYDPRKVEQLLRAWDIDPIVWMEPTVSYQVDDEKLLKLVATGTLKSDDVEACRYDRTYALQKPKLVKRETHE